MILADYHMHSSCSFDAVDTMADMARAAYDRGIRQIVFTDHCDFDIPETIRFSGPGPFEATPEQRAQLEEARAAVPGDMRLAIGLELGEGNHDPQRAVAVYAASGYDFILGSLHNLRGMEDFYYLNYESNAECYDLYDRYLDELIELASIPCFDVMAHIGYCRRYMHKQGWEAALTLARHGDKLDTLFRILIENGRGIELNCADLLPDGREDALLEAFPSVPILRRYRELGGEIITVGSDSHCVRAAGVGVEAGYAMLRENGFRHVTLFNRHRPEFIPI